MPIEIRELLIKAEVSGTSGANASTENGKSDQEEIVEESVRRVLEVLRKKEER